MDRVMLQRTSCLAGLATLSALAACKPPPTDADMARDMPEAAPAFASDPLASPDTAGAVWALSERVEGRLIYGVPGAAAVLAVECDLQASPLLRITRLSPADKGAGALLAMVGNGHIGRVKVDAAEVDGRSIWVGGAPALDEVWEPLAGVRELIATVPGAGTVALNPSPMPGLLIEACRAGEVLDKAALEAMAEPEEPQTAPESEPSTGA